MKIGKGEVKQSENNLHQYHSVNHKRHVDCPGIASGALWREAAEGAQNSATSYFRRRVLYTRTSIQANAVNIY
jgi:hypothetical protein